MFGGGGAAAAGGRGSGGGGQNRGRHVVSLTQEEMDSVNRLMELGFSQQDAAAAFLACDKNEALAANLLLEGWTADAAHY
jgi:UV excision repair protein RAD23